MTPEEFQSRWGKVLAGEESYEDAKKRIVAAPSQADAAPPSPTPKPAASGQKAYRQVKAQTEAKPELPATEQTGVDYGPPPEAAPALRPPPQGMAQVKEFEDQNPVQMDPAMAGRAYDPYSAFSTMGDIGGKTAEKIKGLLKRAGATAANLGRSY